MLHVVVTTFALRSQVISNTTESNNTTLGHKTDTRKSHHHSYATKKINQQQKVHHAQNVQHVLTRYSNRNVGKKKVTMTYDISLYFCTRSSSRNVEKKVTMAYDISPYCARSMYARLSKTRPALRPRSMGLPLTTFLFLSLPYPSSL